MGTKMGVAFANIFVAKIEREILRQSCTELYMLVWKRYQILTTCSPLWDTIVEVSQLSNVRLQSQKQRLHSWT